MNKFSEYKNCKHLICCETFDTEANGVGLVPNIKFTFEKGAKYSCEYVKYNNDYFIKFPTQDIAFYGGDNNDVKLIYENFMTLNEHRKTIINELL